MCLCGCSRNMCAWVYNGVQAKASLRDTTLITNDFVIKSNARLEFRSGHEMFINLAL